MNNQSWECHKCGAVMAPNNPMCFYCKPKKESDDTLISNGPSEHALDSFHYLGTKVCAHQYDWTLLLTNPPKRRCVKCGFIELMSVYGL